MILNLNRGSLIYWDTVWSTCTPSYAKEQGTCTSSTGDKLSSGDDQDPYDTVLTQNKEDTLSLKQEKPFSHEETSPTQAVRIYPLVRKGPRPKARSHSDHRALTERWCT